MANETRYETSDIALSAYLLTSGSKLIEIDRENRHRALFIFSYPAPDVLTRWQSGEAQVNCLAYHNNYQKLKALLFGRRD